MMRHFLKNVSSRAFFSLRKFCRGRGLRTLAVGLIAQSAAALLWAEPPAADSSEQSANYEWGKGLKIADSGWTVGGYATGLLDYPAGRDAELNLSHLSLFSWWEGEGRLKFFSEFDWEDAVATQSSALTTDSQYLDIERLYIDYAHNDHLNFRIGKFLTPIGRWNLIHADPLVWTTSRPLITDSLFPLNATGAMLFGSVDNLGRPLDYAIYSTVGADIKANPKFSPFKDAVGIHLATPLFAESQLGFSYANFKQTNGRSGKKDLFGADFVWSHDGYELSAEAAYRFSERASKLDKKGLYLQAVLPLVDRVYGVIRFEPYSSNFNPSTRVWVAGLTWRLNPALVAKAEYVHGNIDRPLLHEGFLSSLSILF